MHLQHWQSLYWERRELWKIDDRSYIETGSIWGRNFFCMPSRIFSSTWGGMMVGRVKLCIWIEREARKYKHTVATTSKYAFFFAPIACLWRGLGWRYFFAISCYYQIAAALEVVCVGLGLYYPPSKILCEKLWKHIPPKAALLLRVSFYYYNFGCTLSK